MAERADANLAGMIGGISRAESTSTKPSADHAPPKSGQSTLNLPESANIDRATLGANHGGKKSHTPPPADALELVTT